MEDSKASIVLFTFYTYLIIVVLKKKDNLWEIDRLVNKSIGEFESLYPDVLFNSLILLLLSNSITSRRDKSILYSRTTVTVLIISAFIAYDNLYVLFLAKGVGIFGGLFHCTATTNSFHIFIFLITSVILLLSSFYPRKV